MSLHLSSLLCQLMSAPRRRRSIVDSLFSMETLEARTLLTHGGSGSSVADISNITVDTAATEQTEPIALITSSGHVGQGRRATPVIDIKQWQGTWNAFTNIPFLGGGTLQIRQLSAKKFEVTTTGFSGNQAYAVKATGDIGLHFKMKGTDFEGKPKVIGFAVNLDPATLTSFSGIAKVGSETHSISATLVENTGPVNANVQVALSGGATADEGGLYSFTLGVQNLGQAAIPEGGLQVLIYFENSASVARDVEYVSSQNVGRYGFSTIEPTHDNGNLVLICTAEALASTSTSTAFAKITVRAPSGTADGLSTLDFSLTAVLADINGGIPPNFEFLTSQKLEVNVYPQIPPAS